MLPETLWQNLDLWDSFVENYSNVFSRKMSNDKNCNMCIQLKKNLYFSSFQGFSRLRMYNKGGSPVAFVEYQVTIIQYKIQITSFRIKHILYKLPIACYTI